MPFAADIGTTGRCVYPVTHRSPCRWFVASTIIGATTMEQLKVGRSVGASVLEGRRCRDRYLYVSQWGGQICAVQDSRCIHSNDCAHTKGGQHGKRAGV